MTIRLLNWIQDLPLDIANDYKFLVKVVERIETCITSEINYDIQNAEQESGRSLTEIEKSTINHPVFEEYVFKENEILELCSI